LRIWLFVDPIQCSAYMYMFKCQGILGVSRVELRPGADGSVLVNVHAVT
jgi:hypothetical protein